MPKIAPFRLFPALALTLSLHLASAEDAPMGLPSAPAAAADTPAVQADPLLPDRLSPGERLFWGENGWFRSGPLTEESRESELGLRRTLLNLHQLGGYLTLATMLATAFAGQMIINGNEDFEAWHKPLAYTTAGLYFTTASFALLAPPPVVRRPGFNGLTMHKTLAWVHFSGMIATPALGLAFGKDHDRRIFHQAAGYVTTAAFAGAMISVTFF